MKAYYNEIDPYAVQWLKNLMDAREISPGIVDDRDIRNVESKDLVGYNRVHLFAGIAGWDYALQLAQFPENQEVWTISCPCPPFSSAGRKKPCPECGGKNPVPHVGRTGFFVCCLCGHEWLADERHLWPEAWRLIRDRRPQLIFGEQVASGDGRTWLSSVRASLEILGYSFGASDLCAASLGAPHIRQRLWFVAISQSGFSLRESSLKCGKVEGQGRDDLHKSRSASGISGLLGHASGSRPQGDGFGDLRAASGELADNSGERQHGREGAAGQAGWRGAENYGGAGGLVHHDGPRGAAGLPEPQQRQEGQSGEPDDCGGQFGGGSTSPSTARPGPTNGHWGAADWLHCRDGKWRPVEPGTFPLAHGATARVGRLRAYGNAIVPQVAAEFIKAVMDILCCT